MTIDDYKKAAIKLKAFSKAVKHQILMGKIAEDMKELNLTFCATFKRKK